MTTATLTLAEFLLARIAEDEATARDAISATGNAEWGTRTYRVVVDGEFEVAEASVPSAAHIARHDPARVLAECAAKRAIVALHVSTSDYSEPWDEKCSEEGYLADPVDCEELRALAAIYSDHPDYRTDWD